MSKKKEYDINRKSYDDKIEDIRKRKRKLRDIQEPSLVKKMKKDLKREQRGAKRSDKSELQKYIKNEINNYKNNNDEIQ